MKRRIQIISIQIAVAVVKIPLEFASGTTWRLETIRTKLMSKLSILNSSIYE